MGKPRTDKGARAQSRNGGATKILEGSARPSRDSSAFAAGTVPAADTLVPGAKVGHYELIRELGRGGMGTVFLARDTKLGRRVAIKFITTTTSVAVGRFVAEARVTAQCQHPNIVVIYEVDTWHGAPYMVLEYVEGRTLSALMRSGRITPERAVNLAISVARALVCAHSVGIVHRDLKPDNVLLSSSGQVKVVDFGVAKWNQDAAEVEGSWDFDTSLETDSLGDLTGKGSYVGTPNYMSPEQFGVGEVDERTDLWALGVTLFRLLSGKIPVPAKSLAQLYREITTLDKPIRSLREVSPGVPDSLVAVVDRCLAKRVDQRWRSAADLLNALESLQSSSGGGRLAEGECPYPGLSSFQERDASRFFGRTEEVGRLYSRLRRRPLIAVAGPSGVGKSSFVRAGLFPALRASGESWTKVDLRPGREPLAALTAAAQIATNTVPGVADLTEKLLVKEPGLFAAVLRHHAKKTQSKLLIFVDQFEELYTLVSNRKKRDAFVSCLAAAADDPSSPLRVVVSMRSDFLDRVSEHPEFAEEFVRGVMLLSPPDRRVLRSALVEPLQLCGYRFADDALVEEMLDELESARSPLPLLQFAGAKLWHGRDRESRVVTSESYASIGGMAGALAQHADEILAGLPVETREQARGIFVRLVTPEGTRAIVDLPDLVDSSDDGSVRALVSGLVDSRLLVVQDAGDGSAPTLELVHESLVWSWPTLRRWLEESQEDSAYLQQLRQVATQWDERERPDGLLWTGEAAQEARVFVRRSDATLSARERAYLTAVIAKASRSARRRRIVGLIGFVFLAGVAGAALVGMLRIKSAEVQARSEAERAKAAESRIQEQLDKISEETNLRTAAEKSAEVASAGLAKSRAQIIEANDQLRRALEESQNASAKLERQKRQLEELREKDRREKERLQKKLRRISDELR